MGKLIHARLDQESDALLRKLRARTGLADSELVRRGLRALADTTRPAARLKIVGLGRFASGKGDLGSNREHLRGFGRR